MTVSTVTPVVTTRINACDLRPGDKLLSCCTHIEGISDIITVDTVVDVELDGDWVGVTIAWHIEGAEPAIGRKPIRKYERVSVLR